MLNKQAGITSAQAPGALNPLLGMLLNMLSGSGSEARGAESGAGQGALTPAALMSLLNPQPGKTPDPAALFKLLGNIMGSFGKPPVPAGAQEQQGEKTRTEIVPPSGRAKGLKKAEGPIKWDPRLGNATG